MQTNLKKTFGKSGYEEAKIIIKYINLVRSKKLQPTTDKNILWNEIWSSMMEPSNPPKEGWKNKEGFFNKKYNFRSSAEPISQLNKIIQLKLTLISETRAGNGDLLLLSSNGTFYEAGHDGFKKYHNILKDEKAALKEIEDYKKLG